MSLFSQPGVQPAYETVATPGVPLPWGDDTPSVSVSPGASFDGAVGGTVAKGRRVGWTLRNASGRIVADADGDAAAFGFAINPQGITYDPVSRSQLFATKGRIYVNQFGPGSTTITVRQLVASGGVDTGGLVFAPREAVLTWLTQIYEPAIARTGDRSAYFHDSHLDATSGAAGALIVFPANAVSFQRSVDLHGVWLLQITMNTLTAAPYSQIATEVAADETRREQSYQYIVRSGDTLTSVARKAIGTDEKKYHHKYSLETMTQLILRLNPDLAHARTVTIAATGGHPATTKTYAAHRLYAGEKLKLPK